MSDKFVKLVKSAKRGRALSQKLRKQFVWVVVIFAVLLFGSAYVVWQHEAAHSTFSEAIWTVLFTLIGQGEFASSPKTITGRLVVFSLSIVGVALLGVIFSELVQRVMNSKLKEMMGMSKCKYKGHTIICGWSERGRLMLVELLGSGKQASVIAHERPANLPHGEVFFISGTPTDDDVLQRAGVMDAHAAIILSDRSTGTHETDIDAKSILVALAVESANPDIYSVIELIHPANERHARLANVDDIIYCDKMLAEITATCAVYNGISAFVRDILCASDNGHHIAAFPVPSEYDGKTVKELFQKVQSEGHLPVGLIAPPEDDPTALEGLWKSHVNPPWDTIIKIPSKFVCITKN